MKKTLLVAAFALLASACTAASAQTTDPTTPPPTTSTTTEPPDFHGHSMLAEKDHDHDDLRTSLTAQNTLFLTNITSLQARVDALEASDTIPHPGHCTETGLSNSHRIKHDEPSGYYGSTVILSQYTGHDLICDNWPAVHIEQHDTRRHLATCKDVTTVDPPAGPEMVAWLETFDDYCSNGHSTVWLLQNDQWSPRENASHGQAPSWSS